MIIRKATINDIRIIHKLAHVIWWPTYRDILDKEQIMLMLQNMYSEKALEQQMNEGIHFLIAERQSRPVGFAGYSLTDDEHKIFKLHKIYVLPSEQRKGTGKRLVEYVQSLVRDAGGKIVELNVNRLNPAFMFYKKLGFEVHKQVDIPYYHYVMNDYVMRKKL